jgi:hypothetical protein
VKVKKERGQRTGQRREIKDQSRDQASKHKQGRQTRSEEAVSLKSSAMEFFLFVVDVDMDGGEAYRQFVKFHFVKTLKNFHMVKNGQNRSLCQA